MCYPFLFFFHKAILNLGAFSIFPLDSTKGTAVPLLPSVNLDLKFHYARQEILQSGVALPPLHFQQEQRPRKKTWQKGQTRDMLERADLNSQIFLIIKTTLSFI
uniref:Uncharacterized protein n=1 Tax=Gossypium raimondii TaxID=29730 RepID=A0A0D2Q746_GOSRA|nr:hypothetical protein B456_006G103800 [Gossypium raimondii]